MTDRNSQGGAPWGWLDWLGMSGALAVIAGPLLGWLRAVPALAAFYLYVLGGILALVAGVSALVQASRGRGFGFGRTAALLAAMVFIVTASAGGGSPLTNDFTTDLEEPPAFEYASTLPANRGRDMSYDAGFADEQRRCCADLEGLKLSMPMGKAFELALKSARAMPGWDVTWNDPASGRIEAVAVTPVFGFEDDVAIRVRSEGSGSQVDMRSKSRDGRGDVGTNAARIRAYLARLRERR